MAQLGVFHDAVILSEWILKVLAIMALQTVSIVTFNFSAFYQSSQSFDLMQITVTTKRNLKLAMCHKTGHVSIANPSQPQTMEPTSTGMNMANHRTPSRRLSLVLPTTDLCARLYSLSVGLSTRSVILWHDAFGPNASADACPSGDSCYVSGVDRV
ncbi:unnamed protein product [Hydatigera taeniaeformis]|uniref:Secreted protein n=1 Tax=Hydatigena taeniaeformis TaxID=6205 RepID=A0A0R3XBM6_HYDTA|nr:unnamed protein product [Hydatigera taeniaeformis]